MGVVSGVVWKWGPLNEETTIGLEVILVATTLRVASWEPKTAGRVTGSHQGLHLKVRNGLHPFSNSHNY